MEKRIIKKIRIKKEIKKEMKKEIRKRWMRRLAVSCLAAFAVLVSGCDNDSGKNDKGTTQTAKIQVQNLNTGDEADTSAGYREYSLPLPEETADIRALREVDGKIFMVTDAHTYSSPDSGASWKMEESEAVSYDGEYLAAAISSEGSFAFCSEEKGIIVKDKQGNQKVIDIVYNEDQKCYSLEFIDENTLLAMDTESNIQVINIESGEVTGKIQAEGEYHYLASAVDGKILTLTGEGVKFYGYQGNMAESNEIVNRLLQQNLADFNSSKGALLAEDGQKTGFYYACRSGLYHYTLGGSISEQLINGNTNSMGDNDHNFYKMAVLPDQSFLIAYRIGDSGIQLKKYAVSESGSSKSSGGLEGQEGELTVYTLYQNDLLEQEINKINRENPGCVVSIEVGLPEGTGLTADDAVKTLNTEILAGTGPDILLLDGMPVEQYCKSGLLADLSGVLDETAQSEGVYEHIAYAYEEDQAVYAIPARFQIPVMIGKKEDLDRITDLPSMVDRVKALKEEEPEMTSIVGVHDQALLEYMFDFCAPAWIGDSGEIREDSLKDFFKAVKEIEDTQKEGVNEADIEAAGDSDIYSDDDSELYIPSLVADGSQALAFCLSKSLNFSKVLLRDIQDTSITFERARGQSEFVFVPKEIIAVNAKGPDQTLAAAFVKEFLSSESQSQFRIKDTAYPVNRTAFQNMKEAELDGLKTTEGVGISEDKCREGFEKIESIAEKLTLPSVTDTMVRDTVMQEGLRCLSGEISLEEAAEAVRQKISLHMAE